MEVIIDGKRYMPVDEADSVHFWYMHDNHTFSKLAGNTLDEIVSQAFDLQSSYGMLCPAILLCGEKEVRRVGPHTHRRSLDDLTTWEEGAEKWTRAMQADALVMRLLKVNAPVPPSTKARNDSSVATNK